MSDRYSQPLLPSPALHSRCRALGLHLALGVLVALACPATEAEAGHSINDPVTFQSEMGPLRTTACLEVVESIYPQPSSKLDSDLAAVQANFEAVLAAIKRKDRDALFQLSDAKRGRDPKQFDQQAAAYFQQLANVEVAGLPRSYELDGLVVLLAKLQSGTRVLEAPFVFAVGEGGTAAFLPYRSDLISYKLLEDWLNAAWGPAMTAVPAYCGAVSVDHANYRVALVPAIGGQTAPASHLILTGAPVNSPGDLRTPATEVQSAVKAIDESLAADKMEDFFNMLPLSTVKKVRTGYLAADTESRAKFKEAILQQQPFFVFDESPLLIVYTKSTPDNVQVMYFTFNSQHKLTWTNAYLVTSIDRVFKKGLLHDAALSRIPFSSFATRQ